MASSLAPIAVVPLLLVLLSSVAFLLVVKKQRSFLPLVPVIQDHWLLGIANFIDAKKMRNILTTRGKDLLVQFSFMGHKILAIGDRQVAKVALKEITGKGFFHNPTPSFVTSGIFSLDTGPEWQQRRVAFRKAFSISSLRRHTTSVARLNEKMRTVLDRAAGSGEVIKIDNIFSQLTVGVICELAFELDIKVFESSTNSLNIDDVMARFFEYAWVRKLPLAQYLYSFPIYPFNIYKAARDKFESTMGTIYDHMKALRDEDKLPPESLAMSLVNFGDLPGIERKHMIAEISTFFVAGMDTTAHTLSFAVYALAQYPEVQRRCQTEVDQWIASHASSGTQIGTLPPYTEATLKECMRRWPVAGPGSMRQVREPDGVQLTPSLHVPQDWWILVSLYTIQNSKEAWGEDAEEFLPERWLPRDGKTHHTHEEEDPLSAPIETVGKNSSSSSVSGPQSALKINSATSDNSHLASPSCYAGSGYSSEELCFLPFSYGLRNCVGMNLALMELRITLLSLISRYHFTLGPKGEEFGMGEGEDLFETVFTLRPRNGCPIRVTKREV